MAKPEKLRELAAWYREFAERAGNPWVWEARLQLAADLEKEADDLESQRNRIGRPPLTRAERAE